MLNNTTKMRQGVYHLVSGAIHFTLRKHLARNIKRIGGLTEAKRGSITLITVGNKIQKACRSAEHNRQNPCRHRVKSTGMSRLFLSGNATYLSHNTKRGYVFFLINTNNACHIISAIPWIFQQASSLPFEHRSQNDKPPPAYVRRRRMLRQVQPHLRSQMF